MDQPAFQQALQQLQAELSMTATQLCRFLSENVGARCLLEEVFRNALRQFKEELQLTSDQLLTILRSHGAASVKVIQSEASREAYRRLKSDLQLTSEDLVSLVSRDPERATEPWFRDALLTLQTGYLEVFAGGVTSGQLVRLVLCSFKRVRDPAFLQALTQFQIGLEAITTEQMVTLACNTVVVRRLTEPCFMEWLHGLVRGLGPKVAIPFLRKNVNLLERLSAERVASMLSIAAHATSRGFRHYRGGGMEALLKALIGSSKPMIDRLDALDQHVRRLSAREIRELAELCRDGGGKEREAFAASLVDGSHTSR
jgi:hypothetical protein